MSDHRRSPRVPLACRIEFSVVNEEVSPRRRAVARDISLGGMFIETEVLCWESDKVVVHVTLPGSKRAMELPGIVRWVSKDGMGVQFRLLGARDTHEITEFVAAAARRQDARLAGNHR
jgi:hypothetical protein